MSSQLPVETPKAAVARIMTMLKKRLDPMLYAQVFSPLNIGFEEVAASRGHRVEEHTKRVRDETVPPTCIIISGPNSGSSYELDQFGKALVRTGNERPLDAETEAAVLAAGRAWDEKRNDQTEALCTKAVNDALAKGYTQAEIEDGYTEAYVKTKEYLRGILFVVAWHIPTKEVTVPAYYAPLKCKYDNKDIAIGSPLVRLTVDKGMQNRSGRAIAFSEEFHSYECVLAHLKELLKTFTKGDWKY